MKDKIVLAYPRVGSEAKGVSLYPPLSVLYLASNLIPDFSVEIFDQRVDPPEKFDALINEEPLVVGVSTMTGIQIKYALELSEKSKAKGIKTVLGGVHPTILPEQTARDERIDYIFAGESEVSFRNFILDLKTGKEMPKIIKSQPVDLNSLSLPYDLVDVENYIHTIAIEGRSLPFLFSRGCPHACTFCCNPVICDRKWRAMNVDAAVSQLENLVEKYDLDAITFHDENMTANPSIFKEFLGKINNNFKFWMQTRMQSLLSYDLNNLEKKGARRLSSGLESGSNKILKEIKKKETIEEYIEVNRRLAKTGIQSWYNYILGFPEETIEDIKATVDLALQMLDENPNAINSTFAMLVPYPGTEIAEKYFPENLRPQTFESWQDFGRYNFYSSFYDQNKMPLYKKIYFSSKFTGRKLQKAFPKDKELEDYTKILINMWRNFDFENEGKWRILEKEGQRILKKLFGTNAY